MWVPEILTSFFRNSDPSLPADLNPFIASSRFTCSVRTGRAAQTQESPALDNAVDDASSDIHSNVADNRFGFLLTRLA